MSWLIMAWVAVTPTTPVVDPGHGQLAPLLSRITVMLTVLVVGGLAAIYAQSYLGRHRHPPEWVDEFEAEELLREKEREERAKERTAVPGSDLSREATRELLERVAQLRGIGPAVAPGSGAEEHKPISLEEAIESARRAPAKFEEPVEPVAAAEPPTPVLALSLTKAAASRNGAKATQSDSSASVEEHHAQPEVAEQAAQPEVAEQVAQPEVAEQVAQPEVAQPMVTAHAGEPHEESEATGLAAGAKAEPVEAAPEPDARAAASADEPADVEAAAATTPDPKDHKADGTQESPPVSRGSLAERPQEKQDAALS